MKSVLFDFKYQVCSAKIATMRMCEIILRTVIYRTIT